jgi:hypothetical protein
MKINLIIGAGQLGSRHLQGLLRLQQEQLIYVMDPSESSLSIAKDRAKEIENQSTINYTTNWETLPAELDLVIVATGANVRSKVVSQLLKNYKVKNLVLEKILFQELASYSEIGKLITATNTPTWVNHPRRMAEHHIKIKEIIAKSNEKIIFNAVGSNWGLACNALHLIDLFSFLANSSVDKIDLNWIDANILESKRANCIELTGSVKGTLKNGSNFNVSSLEGEIGDITICVFTNSNRWIIQEGSAQKIIHLSKQNNFNEEITSFTTEFQSTLTTRIAFDLFKSENCNLPTYKQACESHFLFIEATLKKYTEITGIETTICPIT